MSAAAPAALSPPRTESSPDVRVLFYKNDFAWPRASGHDVHTFNMMHAMQRLGAQIALVTRHEPPPPSIAGLSLQRQETLRDSKENRELAVPLRGLEERFRSYWGVPNADIARLGAIASDFGADAVVVSGLDVLPMLGAVQNAARVWYAADEWLWHHLSQVKLKDRSSWTEIREGVVKGLYERAYRHRVDRTWVVSSADARAMRWFAGMRGVDILPNGVDGDWYQPTLQAVEPETAVFWGRLDFGPNIQALQWFCRDVWPLIRARHPRACFTIIGFNPTPAMRALANTPGIRLLPDMPDLRDEVARNAVVVLPFVSGGGIKNKLLEAAAMGKPVVCTPLGASGIRHRGDAPIRFASTAEQFAAAVADLWTDDAKRRALGEAARAWVLEHHTWQATARQALDELSASVPAAKSVAVPIAEVH
jgi:polysaccharide biosynthesis protein PslH